jgi:hypothetical protein
MDDIVFVNINEWFGEDYVNMTCSMPDFVKDPIPSHPTRQAAWAVVFDGELMDVACNPHKERITEALSQ